MAKTGKLHLLGPKFSKMTASNFGPNSLCGPSTVFQRTWPNQGGAPQDPSKKLQLNIRTPGENCWGKGAWCTKRGLGGILGHERFPKRSPGGSCGTKGKKRAWGRARDDNKRGRVNFWEQSRQKRFHPQTKPPKTNTKGRLADIPRQNHQKRAQKDAWRTSSDKTPKNDSKRTPGGRPRIKPPETITKGRLVNWRLGRASHEKF